MEDHKKKHYKNRRHYVSRWLLGVAAIILSVTTYFLVSIYRSRHADTLITTFFDVGSGDAVLIKTPSGKKILIDGGPDATTLRRLSSALPFYDRSIDLVIVSHVDSGAIDGLVNVMDSYRVSEVLEPDTRLLTSSTTAYKVFEQAVSDKNIPRLVAEKGMNILLDEDVSLDVLFSSGGSVIARLSYGNTSFLFTGNATQKMEREAMVGSTLIKSDLLLVGHNGSHTASAPDFISAVSAKYAVISVDAKNRYGYPNQVTLDTLAKSHATVFETGKIGTLSFVLDGKSVKKE